MDAVIRQLDPAYPIDAMAANVGRSHMARAVLDVLRSAVEPLTTAAVTKRVAALWGPQPPGGAAPLREERRAGAEAPARQGVVTALAKARRAMLWELAG